MNVSLLAAPWVEPNRPLGCCSCAATGEDLIGWYYLMGVRRSPSRASARPVAEFRHVRGHYGRLTIDSLLMLHVEWASEHPNPKMEEA